MSKLKIGINEYMDDSVYHGDREYLSSSVLKEVLEDPESLRLKRIQNIAQEDKSVFIIGRYIHWKFLEPHREDTSFAIFGGAKRFGAKWNEFKSTNEDKAIMTRSERVEADDVVSALFEDELSASMIREGEAEVTACAKLLGTPIKARADFLDLKNRRIIDLKTTSFPLTKESLLSIVIKRKYHLSAALYIDVFNKSLKKEEQITDFILIFANKKSKQVSVVRMGERLLNEGRDLYKSAIREYKALNEQNFFTEDYKPSIQTIDL